MAKSLLERFNEKYIPEPNSGCWLWLAGGSPYGTIRVGAATDGMIAAHRASYELFVGAIPNGLEIDHKCRVQCCVNPAHLEPVTHHENVIRGDVSRLGKARYLARTHCKHGHKMTEENTSVVTMKQGYRRRACRECGRIRGRAHYWKR